MLSKMQLLIISALLFLGIPGIAQQTVLRSISGAVRDSADAPLIGLTVTEAGARNSTTTNEQGVFTLKVKAFPTAIIITGVGFKEIKVEVTNSEPVTVVMMTDSKELSDVVVVGYGTQKKAKVTGAVSTIKMDEVLGERPVSTTASLLQGVIPGLQVSISSGQPGAGASLNVRGGTGFGTTLSPSFSSDGPLILVDNTPLNGPLNMIDPNDIESITVLKDAGSAAIYGARSAFGVVLVTTKKGAKNQKTQFNYSNNIVVSQPTNLPRKASPLQTVQHYIDGGRTGYYGGQDLLTWKGLLEAYTSDPGKYPLGYTTIGNTYYQLQPTDAVNDLLGNNATQFMQNLSFSGGSDKTTYRISLGSTNENGILVPQANQDGFKRYTFKSNLTSDIKSWFTTQVDANYFYALTTRPSYDNAFGDAANLPSFLATDTIPGLNGNIATGKYMITQTEPVTYRYDEVRLTGRAILRPFAGFTVTGEYTFDNIRNLVSSYDKIVSGQLNPYGYTPQSYGTGKYTKNHNFTDYQTLNIFGTYARKFDDHNFSLTGGFNQEFRNYEQEVISRTGMINADIPSISTGTGVIEGTDNYSQFATRGFFGRFGYDYQGKYIVEFNGRYDGSSRFPEVSRWGFFPSGSIGWRVTEENFMENTRSWLSNLKFRASYGTVGNQNIGEYQYYAGMNPTQPNWLHQGVPVTTLTAPGLISPDFTWESVTTRDLGVDFGFLKNKLTGSFDYYIRDVEDILSSNDRPVPAVLGTSAPLENTASLRTKGFELELTWRDRVGKVGYFLTANLFDYTSKVTKINNPNNLISQLYVGRDMGEIWGYATDRFYTVNDFVEGTLNSNLQGGTLKPGTPRYGNQAPNPGDILYRDLDSNGVINEGAATLANPGDRMIIGNSTARYQYGFRGGISYANFEFSFAINGVGKQDQWRANQLTFPNYWQTYGALYAHQTNYWTPEHTEAYYGRIYTDAAGGTAQTFNQIVQSKFLMNGAYMRVRNLTLSYNIAQNILKRYGIKKLTVAASVENPFTFHHMPEGLFPDVSSIGSTAGGGQGYPFMKKWSFGVNLNF